MVQSIYELMMQGWTVLEQIASEFCLIKGPSFLACHHAKGNLISESFSLWFQSPKMVPNHYPEHHL